MNPVIAAVAIGGILYLIFGDDEKEKSAKDGKLKESEQAHQPTIADLRRQLKIAVREKKKKEPTGDTAAVTEIKLSPVSPSEGSSARLTTPGTGRKTRKK